jgi:hypothetical protein
MWRGVYARLPAMTGSALAADRAFDAGTGALFYRHLFPTKLPGRIGWSVVEAAARPGRGPGVALQSGRALETYLRRIRAGGGESGAASGPLSTPPRFDPVWGGLGGAPKFPAPSNILFCFGTRAGG